MSLVFDIQSVNFQRDKEFHSQISNINRLYIFHINAPVLSCVQKAQKRTRKRKFSLMFATYSLIIFSLFFDLFRFRCRFCLSVNRSLPRFVKTSVMQLYHPDLPASDTLQFQQNFVKFCRIKINCSIINFGDHIGMCIDISVPLSTFKHLLSRYTNRVFLIQFFFRNTRSWHCWHFCIISNVNSFQTVAK